MTARIALIVEGPTEVALRPTLLEFLEQRLSGRMPVLDFLPENGRIPKQDKLRRKVELLLLTNDAVIAITDVYTGANPREFENAADARAKMSAWVGNQRCYPHAAQYEFEAWLLPYWPEIQKLSGSNRSRPSANPENVNHNRPPSEHLRAVFRAGGRRTYKKTRDAAIILRGKDLGVAASACPELRAFLNTIITLSGGSPL